MPELYMYMKLETPAIFLCRKKLKKCKIKDSFKKLCRGKMIIICTSDINEKIYFG